MALSLLRGGRSERTIANGKLVKCGKHFFGKF
jgi:hypothetical protein